MGKLEMRAPGKKPIGPPQNRFQREHPVTSNVAHDPVRRLLGRGFSGATSCVRPGIGLCARYLGARPAELAGAERLGACRAGRARGPMEPVSTSVFANPSKLICGQVAVARVIILRKGVRNLDPVLLLQMLLR
jgi:hypothetical protein